MHVCVVCPVVSTLLDLTTDGPMSQMDCNRLLYRTTEMRLLSTILQAQHNSSADSDCIYRFIECFVTEEYLLVPLAFLTCLVTPIV